VCSNVLEGRGSPFDCPEGDERILGRGAGFAYCVQPDVPPPLAVSLAPSTDPGGPRLQPCFFEKRVRPLGPEQIAPPGPPLAASRVGREGPRSLGESPARGPGMTLLLPRRNPAFGPGPSTSFHPSSPVRPLADGRGARDGARVWPLIWGLGEGQGVGIIRLGERQLVPGPAGGTVPPGLAPYSARKWFVRMGKSRPRF